MPSGVPSDPILAILQQEALAAIAQAGYQTTPSMPSTNEGLEAQFFVQAHIYFQAWLEHNGGPKTGTAPLAIVLSRAIGQDMERLGAEQVFYFETSSDTDHGGEILISNYDLSVVARIPSEPCGNLQALGKALTSAGLHEGAHCVLRGDLGEIVLCEKGANGSKSRLNVTKPSLVKLDPPAIDTTVWEFHRKFTQTSSGILRPWKGKASDRVTDDNFELKTSSMLGFYLGTIVGHDNVTVEDQQPHGRVDIKVSSHAMAPGFGPCAMECKVLRSRRPSGNASISVSEADMIQHATEGVQQAVEYRLDLNGKLAYLFCFDARTADADQPQVQAFAAQQDVTLRRYYMYSSPADHRKAATEAKKTGQLLAGEPA